MSTKTREAVNECGEVVAVATFGEDIVIGAPSEEEPVSRSKIRLKAADPIEVLRKKISHAHTEALSSMVDSVRHAAECGSHLIEAKNLVSDPFRDWVGKNFPFTYRTAYRYIRIAEAVADGALDLNGVTSINEALKLLAAAAKEDEKEEDKEEKDERIETFVTAAMKIESWFKKETSKSPLSTWSAERRRVVKSQLDGVVAIHEALGPVEPLF